MAAWQSCIVHYLILPPPVREGSGPFNRNNPIVRGQMFNFNYDTAEIQHVPIRKTNTKIRRYKYTNADTHEK